MSDDPLTECPVCGGKVRRVVGSVGIVFKGKGFYVTDHRNGSGRVQTSEKSEKSSDAKDKSDKPKKNDSGSDKAKSSAAAASASAPG
jgi:predicted nucleic acid-binding Zn ribbon protein